jgi:hypothetical protein
VKSPVRLLASALRAFELALLDATLGGALSWAGRVRCALHRVATQSGALPSKISSYAELAEVLRPELRLPSEDRAPFRVVGYTATEDGISVVLAAAAACTEIVIRVRNSKSHGYEPLGGGREPLHPQEGGEARA